MKITKRVSTKREEKIRKEQSKYKERRKEAEKRDGRTKERQRNKDKLSTSRVLVEWIYKVIRNK